MPEQEFEIYLSLLSRLLRLSPVQKAAISDELRDHLEERLAELLNSGASREEAIKLAMEEFGDVTGLALDLARVSRTPLRKVVVRSTAVASVAAAVVVCWLTLFVPEHRIAPPAIAQAQQAISELLAEVQKPPVQVPQAVIVVDDELFPAFLTKPTNVNFADTPLTEVCAFLEEEHQVPVRLRRVALNDNGFDVETPVNLSLNGLTLEEVLNHLTRQLALSWHVDRGVVQIGPHDEFRFINRSFDLDSLIDADHASEELVDVLRVAVGPWDDESEGGTTAVIGGSVIVRQTYQNQRRIAQVLAAIKQRQPMVALGVCSGRERLFSTLQSPGTIEFNEVPFQEALNFLAEAHVVPIVIDVRALEDSGLASDLPVTAKLNNRPLAQLLDATLSELGLSWYIRNGVILVTTSDAEDNELLTIVYDLSDFADAGMLTQLSEAILTTTNGSWEQTSGEGGKLAQFGNRGLVIVQRDRVHLEIQTMIERLRRSLKARATNLDADAKPAKPARKKLVTKTYPLSKEVAGDLSAALRNLVASDSWANAVDGEMPMIGLVASRPRMEEVDGLVSGGDHEIRVLNPPQPLANANPKTTPSIIGTSPPPTKSIVVHPRATLVIRQTPQVHREIEKFLQHLNVFEGTGGDVDTGGFGGGSGTGGGFF